MIIDKIVLANNAYVVLVGYRLFDEKAAVYDNLIRQWQFKSGLLAAVSPYSVTDVVTVSSKMVDGVSVFTSELRENSYCY